MPRTIPNPRNAWRPVRTISGMKKYPHRVRLILGHGGEKRVNRTAGVFFEQAKKGKITVDEAKAKAAKLKKGITRRAFHAFYADEKRPFTAYEKSEVQSTILRELARLPQYKKGRTLENEAFAHDLGTITDLHTLSELAASARKKYQDADISHALGMAALIENIQRDLSARDIPIDREAIHAELMHPLHKKTLEWEWGKIGTQKYNQLFQKLEHHFVSVRSADRAALHSKIKAQGRKVNLLTNVLKKMGGSRSIHRKAVNEYKTHVKEGKTSLRSMRKELVNRSFAETQESLAHELKRAGFDPVSIYGSLGIGTFSLRGFRSFKALEDAFYGSKNEDQRKTAIEGLVEREAVRKPIVREVKQEEAPAHLRSLGAMNFYFAKVARVSRSDVAALREMVQRSKLAEHDTIRGIQNLILVDLINHKGIRLSDLAHHIFTDHMTADQRKAVVGAVRKLILGQTAYQDRNHMIFVSRESEARLHSRYKLPKAN